MVQTGTSTSDRMHVLSLSVGEPLYKRLLQEKHRRQAKQDSSASMAGIIREAVITYVQAFQKRRPNG